MGKAKEWLITIIPFPKVDQLEITLPENERFWQNLIDLDRDPDHGVSSLVPLWEILAQDAGETMTLSELAATLVVATKIRQHEYCTGQTMHGGFECKPDSDLGKQLLQDMLLGLIGFSSLITFRLQGELKLLERSRQMKLALEKATGIDLPLVFDANVNSM